MENNYSDVLVGYEDKRKIYIEYGEYLRILKFAKAGASDGTRGVLLGYENKGEIYILRVIETVYSGDEELEGPTFSPQSWGRIEAETLKEDGYLKIIGQFSTHLSVIPVRSDYVMQEKYFNKSSNVLFIFDPCNNEEKFYFYDDREFIFVNGFYLFDKFKIPIDLKYRENILRPILREYEMRMRIFDDIKKKIRFQSNVFAAIFGIIILLLIYSAVNFYSLEKKIENYSLSDKEIIEWKNE